MKTIAIAGASFLAMASIVCSCQPDEIKGLDARYVSGVVETENGIETKASAADKHIQTIEINEDGLDLFITTSREVNTMSPFGVATKGSIVTSAGTDFKMSMVTSSGTLYKEGTAGPSGTGDYWSMFSSGAKVEWPADADAGAKYDFYAFLGNEPSITYGTTSKIEYAGNAPAGPDAQGAYSDAASMEDMLLAYTKGFGHDHETYGTKAGLVPLHFYHALAAVRFNVSPDVRRVTINGIQKDGSADVVAVDPTEEDDFTKAFVWTAKGTKVSYSQSNTGNPEDLTFFIVPQTLSEVTITFEVEKDGVVHQITTPAGRLGTDNWTAGYIYKYTMDSTTEGNVAIRVVERFLANMKTKDHVGVRSTARSTVYVRAYIVGNWCDDHHNVVASWDGSAIVYESGENKPWFKDGKYYYLKNPLVGYATSEDLIKTFTDNSTAPKEGLHLELNVLSQGIEWDKDKVKVTTAWGESIASRLN